MECVGGEVFMKHWFKKLLNCAFVGSLEISPSQEIHLREIQAT